MARKKEFDPEIVLKRAVELFWKKGYANTSLNDLVECLGINRFSLYSTFGDKKTLYLTSLNYYIDHHSVPALQNLTQGSLGLVDLKEYLIFFSKLQYQQTSGCFVQNAILELSLIDQQVSEAGQRLYSLILDGFCCVLERAKKSGEIAVNTDVSKISSFLLLQIQGVRVLGKAKQYTVMEDGVQVIIEYLDNLRIVK